ncbi:MAG: ABC transporter ATP-binding protein [Actinomycetota bacterium]|nr:ABC transporter ATP-binding protein [Actinomycetota bacterium]
MESIIRTDHLTKYYGKVHALNDASISIKRGEIYGFLGLNGAGKSTTILLLLGIIHPTAGASFLYGKKVSAGNNSLWKNVGYLLERQYSYPELTVSENLEIIRRLRNISDKKSIDATIARLKLNPYKEVRAKNLSLGNVQRLGLAKALLHNPDILILDEPVNGLDPAGIVEIRELLKDLASTHGVTIFISSHILGEISRLATRIGIIHQGRLIQEIDTNELENLCRKRLVLDTDNKKAARLKLLENGYSVSVSREGLLEVEGADAIRHPENIANILVYAGLPPKLLKVEEENLESYFLRAIGVIGGDVK